MNEYEMTLLHALARKFYKFADASTDDEINVHYREIYAFMNSMDEIAQYCPSLFMSSDDVRKHVLNHNDVLRALTFVYESNAS